MNQIEVPNVHSYGLQNASESAHNNIAETPMRG